MIYLVRHGQTDWNIERRIMGQTDIPLNETGRAQVESLESEVSKLGIEHIFSSDLSRTRETAEILNKYIGVDITLDRRLREINYGDNIVGKIVTEITDEDWDEFNNRPEEVNAESNDNIYNRIKGFFEDLSKRDFSNVLVVTHGGALRMMMYYLDNKDGFNQNLYFEKYLNFKFPNASIIKLKI